MKTATHTPGPWASHGRSIFCEKGKMIGAAHLRRGEKIDVSFANALLIAAAPDLLAALEGMVNNAIVACEDDYTVQMTQDEWEAHCTATEAACAAIAKATGAA